MSTFESVLPSTHTGRSASSLLKNMKSPSVCKGEHASNVGSKQSNHFAFTMTSFSNLESEHERGVRQEAAVEGILAKSLDTHERDERRKLPTGTEAQHGHERGPAQVGHLLDLAAIAHRVDGRRQQRVEIPD